jgi:O-acetyl-ADP-ribose deacetylase
MAKRLEAMVGRIETLAIDAVVNAANRQLLPGTGVDGALRHAAGPELTRLTQTMAPIRNGEAVLTPGFAAPARFIIHTAAPIWVLPGEDAEKIATLASCYRACIALADQHALSTIAFPCLGTGNFGWPREVACETAIDASRAALDAARTVEHVVFCCFTDADAALYRHALTQ